MKRSAIGATGALRNAYEWPRCARQSPAVLAGFYNTKVTGD